MAQQLPTQSQFGDYSDWPGRDVLDASGQRLGGVREIYLDRDTGQPEWVLVDLDESEARFVPLTDADVEGWSIRIAHAADKVREAPGIGTEPRIDEAEERRLYAHYGLGSTPADAAKSPSWGETPSWQARGGEPSDQPAPFSDASAEPEATTASEDGTPPWRREETASPLPEATNEAPPPADPPTPAELEAAHIPDEPPAASDRAAEYETAPFGAVPPPAPADDATTPAAEDSAAAFLTDDTTAPETPPADEDPKAPEAPATFSSYVTDTPDEAPPAEPPAPDSVVLTDATGEAVPVEVAETPPARDTPAPAPSAFTPPTPGALEPAKRSPAKIALAAAAAAALFFIVRKLR